METIFAGCAAAAAGYFINRFLINSLPLEFSTYSKYIAPIIEEFLKAAFIIYLLYKNKMGFMVNAAIYGFAADAGFAFIENIYYLISVSQSNLIIWFIRGFGTAVMHGGTTAIFAIITKNIIDRKKGHELLDRFPGFLPALYNYLPGILLAIFIHSFFNHFIFSPVLLILLPAIIFYVLNRSEILLKQWMESGMDNDCSIARTDK